MPVNIDRPRASVWMAIAGFGILSATIVMAVLWLDIGSRSLIVLARLSWCLTPIAAGLLIINVLTGLLFKGFMAGSDRPKPVAQAFQATGWWAPVLMGLAVLLALACLPSFGGTLNSRSFERDILRLSGSQLVIILCGFACGAACTLSWVAIHLPGSWSSR
ncbi:MAG: hypothetical protein JKP90_11865 [Desulfofustis sp. PB-SRB1]|jgi:hypothetical protein|nr:hypothetical protein [Desulfofustis sp. PB-SRB1]